MHLWIWKVAPIPVHSRDRRMEKLGTGRQEERCIFKDGAKADPVTGRRVTLGRNGNWYWRAVFSYRKLSHFHVPVCQGPSSSYLFIGITQLLRQLAVAVRGVFGQWEVNKCDAAHWHSFSIPTPLLARGGGNLWVPSEATWSRGQTHQPEFLNDHGAEPIPPTHTSFATSLDCYIWYMFLWREAMTNWDLFVITV